MQNEYNESSKTHGGLILYTINLDLITTNTFFQYNVMWLFHSSELYKVGKVG